MSGADSGRQGRREVAHRLFAVEYEDADFQYSDSEEERAPNYVVTPTGARVNRVFVVGVLTEVEPVSDDVLRARIVDPTGAFVAYAGQYQPEAVAFLEAAEAPSFVSLTGKARTFQPEGSEQVFTSVRPESITTVDAPTRDRWTVQAAEHTLARIATMHRALQQDARGEDLTGTLRDAGVAESLAAGVPLAIDHYGTTPGYLSALREQALAATEVVAEDRETVPDLELAPGDDGPVTDDLGSAPAVAGTITGDAEFAAAPEPAAAAADTPEPEPSASEPETPPAGSEPDAEPEPVSDEEAETEALGDFEASEVAVDASEPAAETYDLDEEERAEVEAEFGTEFSAGSEVPDPGEAGIEPESAPAPDEEPGEVSSSAEETDSPGADPVETTEADADTAETAPDEGSEPADEPAVDLEDAAVEAMADLDEGDGADRDAVVEAVVESHDADPAAVEDAIQDALMGGRCYEPADGTLKAI